MEGEEVDLWEQYFTPIDEERRLTASEYHSYFGIDSWYSSLQEHTFPTKFVELPLAQAKAIFAHRERYLFHINLHAIDETPDAGDVNEGEEKRPEKEKEKEDQLIDSDSDDEDDNTTQLFWDDNPDVYNPDFVTVEQRRQLDQLIQTLDEAIQPFVQSAGGAFIRLATRSPKDAVLRSRKIRRFLEEEIKSRPRKTPEENTDVQDVIAFVRAQGKSWKVSSGKEAVALLLNSQRVFKDLGKALMTEHIYNMKIAVREWRDIKPDWEFRAFSVNWELTSCTQYNDVCYVEEIYQNKEKIQRLLLDFFSSMKHKVPLPSQIKFFTIDFLVDLENEENPVSIIEINHPPPTAGSSLFRWSLPEDRKIIENGPFEFRVFSALPEGVMIGLQPQLVEYIQELRTAEREALLLQLH